MSTNPNKLHYGWIIVASGTLCVFACLGLGRFALGMLLPSMSGPLGLNYSQMGFISTANFVGYLLSVSIAGHVSARMGARQTIIGSLLIVGTSMLLISRCGGFIPIMLLYFFTGVGSGGANIPMMGLVSAWFSRISRGRAAGFIAIGSGFAIILSGRLVPYISAHAELGGWRMSWMVLGGMVLAAAIICGTLLRNNPKELGLEPVGAALAPPREVAVSPKSLFSHGVIYHLGALYFLFGFTYVIYATFVVTSLVRERGYTEAEAGALWSIVGLVSLISGPLFGTLSDKIGRKNGLALVFALQAISYALMATGLPGAPLYLSIFCYGIAVWSIPSIMAAAVGDYVGSVRAPQAFGLVTSIFALGQISGPAAAGMIAQASGGFSSSFAIAAALAFSAIGLAMFLKKPSA